MKYRPGSLTHFSYSKTYSLTQLVIAVYEDNSMCSDVSERGEAIYMIDVGRDENSGKIEVREFTSRLGNDYLQELEDDDGAVVTRIL